jgi:hypothetical protein
MEHSEAAGATTTNEQKGQMSCGSQQEADREELLTVQDVTDQGATGDVRKV